MKKAIRGVLCVSVLCFSAAFAEDPDSIDIYRDQTEDLYQTSSGAHQDSSYRAIGKSMIAWGIGLSAAIAIIASAIHQSDSDTASTQ